MPPRRHPLAWAAQLAQGRFTHRGEDCTFETVVKEFGLAGDPVLREIAEIVLDTLLLLGAWRGWESLHAQEYHFFTREVLRGNRNLTGALAGITAAAVGVILNLALVFTSSRRTCCGSSPSAASSDSGGRCWSAEGLWVERDKRR